MDGRVALISGGSRGIGAETVGFLSRRAHGSSSAIARRGEWRRRSSVRRAERNGAFRLSRICVSPRMGARWSRPPSSLLGGWILGGHQGFGLLRIDLSLMAETQWRRTMAVNLDSVFGLVQASVGQIEWQGRPATDGPTGHIVLISSTAGQRGEAFHADYAVTKGALISLTKEPVERAGAARDPVNCVAPGWVATEMSAGCGRTTRVGHGVKAGRFPWAVWPPREIAGPVLFLCTPLAGFISGEVLNVNGGAVMVG